MANSTPAIPADIETTNLTLAPGVTLTDHQQGLTGSVLDLFAGRVTPSKLALWHDAARFEDPLCLATSRTEYEAQWHGLAAAFAIERLSHEVTSGGNPIVLSLKQTYNVKGTGEGVGKTIDSTVEIDVDEQTGKIAAVRDKWNGSLPDGKIAETFRRLNARTMPMFTGPKEGESGGKQQ